MKIIGGNLHATFILFLIYTLLNYIRVIVPHMGAAWYAVVVDVRATPTYLPTHLNLAKWKA